MCSGDGHSRCNNGRMTCTVSQNTGKPMNAPSEQRLHNVAAALHPGRAAAGVARSVYSYARDRKLTAGKFIVVSGSAVALNLLLLFLLVQYLGFHTAIGENAANAISMEASIVYNFFMSRAITWRDRRRETGARLAVQVLKFHFTIGITIVLRLALYPLLQYYGVHSVLNAAVGIGLAAVVNFIVYDTWIFKRRSDGMFTYDVCAVGGCGRVGLPLSLAFAGKGLNVVIYDLNRDRLETVKGGVLPFLEEGGQELLEKTIGKNLTATDDPNSVSRSKFVICCIDTPVGAHMDPEYSAMVYAFTDLLPYLSDGQYIVLRSTVYPGTAEKINEFLKEKGAKVHVAFCPERVVEGKVLSELDTMPQIVSAFDEEGVEAVSDLFRSLTPDIVVVDPMEAELAKLFTNALRYVQFSIANQFFTLAHQRGLDYYKIHHAVTHKYPRAAGLARAGLTAGPCLFKDTMQLAAFSMNSFFLGHAAMLVNEGLPNYIVERLKERTELRSKSVGILGMAYKADSDDGRDSLAFKLRRILQIEAREVRCSDPYVTEPYFVSAEELIDSCDVIVVGAPHGRYRDLSISDDKIVVDVWNFFGKGGKF